jgi:hypothetical protein
MIGNNKDWRQKRNVVWIVQCFACSSTPICIGLTFAQIFGSSLFTFFAVSRL